MNQNQQQHKRIIISGGGTGGHIFPAIAIANALREKDPSTEILFVGAEGKMEMEKVPAAGYRIIGLPVRGFQRRLTLKNISFFWKLYISLKKARKIINEFKPDVVVGVGGYASGPVLRIACKKGIPAVIQEQNSFPGVTNKILASKVNKICVAYEGMERFFPKEKIILTGNPVRQILADTGQKKEQGLLEFELSGNKRTILLSGGSLGARTLNHSIAKKLDLIVQNKLQLIWQTGKDYYETAKNEAAKYNTRDIKVFDFIKNMDLAYAVSDVVVARAGAITISELCLVHKPAILVPSPNVAEDHQTKNAMALVKINAVEMIEDKEAEENLVPAAIALINDEYKKNIYRENISKIAIKNSAALIASEIFNLAENKK